MNDAFWLLLAVILLLDLLIVVTRFCLMQTNQSRLLELRDQFPNAVDRTVNLLRRPSLRIALRMALIACHFLLAGIAWLLTSPLPPTRGWAISLLWLVAAAFILVAVESLLERMINRNSERWALQLTPFGSLLDYALRPFTWLLIRLAPPNVAPRNFNSVTEDELKTWLVETQETDTLETGEKKMIYSIFQFGDTLCREIMVPRIDILTLDVNTSPTEAIRSILMAGHSRVPVYEENIDNVIGLLYAKDLLKLQTEGEDSLTIRSLLRPAYFVPEAKKVDELLREMRSQRMHMAIVVDEYGGVAGLVTLEDVLEEIIGEIRDEYDQGEESMSERISAEEYLLSGRIDLGDLNDLLGTHIHKESADTLGGYIYGEMGRVPSEGDSLQIAEWTLTVQKVSRRRITKVLAHRTETRSPAMHEAVEEIKNAAQ